MRKFLTGLIGVLLVFSASGAWAGGYRYGYGYGHGYPAYHYGYRHGHGRHHGHGYVAGALIVGTLLGYAISNSNRPAHVVQRQPVYYDRPVRRTRGSIYGSAPDYVPGSYSRYYLRDTDGNCYLVNVFENGDESWTAVPSINCD